MEWPAYMAYTRAKKHVMTWDTVCCWNCDPLPGLQLFYEGHFRNNQYINDPVYNEMLKYSQVSKDGVPYSEEEIIKHCKEMDLYQLGQYWSVTTVEVFSYTLWQPWLKGFSGEMLGSRFEGNQIARWWIDKDVKKSLGY